jgi:hypothetical protein
VSAPAPLSTAELQRCLERLESGVPFKQALEELLLDLSPERAEELAALLGEARCAWFPLLHGSGGRALLIGNGFSATAHTLAAVGYRPVLFDGNPERMRFEKFRCEELTGVPCECVVGDDSGRLPFDDDSFDLLVQGDGLPGVDHGGRYGAAELRRVTRGEVVVIGDNRFGYKRWLGRRGSFRVQSPLRFLARALRPRGGERSLIEYRRMLCFEECASPEALALYPHADDFTHVVGLDGAGPSLHVGPMERRNRLKVLGNALGLFPVFTPSFAVISTHRELASQPRRIDRVLQRIAEELDEPTPIVDELLATRGNTALLLTRAASDDPTKREGRWCIRLSLSPAQDRQIQRHHEVVGELWSRGSPVRVPEPLFHGEVEGLRLTCERRLPGYGSPQLSSDPAIARRMFEEVASDFAGLVVEPPGTIDDYAFETFFGARFDLVASFAARAETERNILRLRESTRERVVGRAMPKVRFHADLRGKHVQIDADGRVLGYIDWGSSLDADVPYFDIVHLLVHQLKQERGGRIEESWKRLLTPDGLRRWERAALEGYVEAVGLDREVARAIEHAYPIFVAGMAEANWDYSRPRWLHHHFGL